MSFAKMVVVGFLIACVPFQLQAGDDSPKLEIYGGYSSLWADLSLQPDAMSFQPYYFNESNLMFGNLILSLPALHGLMNPPKLQHLPGFEISSTYNINKWLGIEAAYQRHAGERLVNHKVTYLNYTNSGDFITTISNIPINVNQAKPIAPEIYDSRNLGDSNTQAEGFGTADTVRTTFLIGPRFTWHTKSRFAPFAHFQLGVSQLKSSNYQMKYTFNSIYHEFDANRTLKEIQTWGIQGKITGDHSSLGLAVSCGGGLDYRVNNLLSVRLLQADYLATRNSFMYNFADHFTSDINDYVYTIVSISQGEYNVNNQPIYSDYTQETRQRVIYSGTRTFSYSVPHQFLNNIKLSAGIVFTF
jgi:hypothetical protein